MNAPSPRLVLRDLPLVTRLLITAFLFSVGIGYFSALVQLHFQAAPPGEPLPGPAETGEIYHRGKEPRSQLERLLVADEKKPFNGSGSMRSAFTTRSIGWALAIRKKAEENKLNPQKKADLLQAEKLLRAEREGEIKILLAWLHAGLPQKVYDEGMVLRGELVSQPTTEKFVTEDKGVKTADVQGILQKRCVRCHSEQKSGPESDAPLETYQQVHGYANVEMVGAGMSLRKLAQTSHVHLLGFAMLYGLTGLIFSFTSYPLWVRYVLAPLPLVAQILEICLGWWGGRAYEPLALAVPTFGAVVALGVFAQIVGSLFNMFGRAGKAVVFVLLVGGAVGIGALKVFIMDPYLADERKGAVLEQADR
jgi:hypothetical protein